MTSPASTSASKTVEEVKDTLLTWLKKPAVIVGGLIVAAVGLSALSDGESDDEDYDDTDDDDEEDD